MKTKAIEASARIPLRAGPWSMDFLDGDLRNLSLGRTEMVQRLCVLVRGAGWETLPRAIASQEVEVRERSFSIVCDCESRTGEVDFRWRLRAEGSEEGEISYLFEGAAASHFYASRIGICVLHSTAEFCCRTISVTTTDGASNRLVLPREIAPWPIFSDVSSVCYESVDLPEVRLTITGELFEAEDQRNWGDASFKIYARPLRFPHPYPVAKGSSFAQSARLTLASPARPRAHAREPNIFRISAFGGSRVPRIGLGFSSTTALSPEQLSLLRELNPAFLSLKYNPRDPGGDELIRSAARLGLPLEIQLASACNEVHIPTEIPVCRWLIEADAQLNPSAPVSLPGNAPLYWGSDKGFVEINRNRWIAQRGDGVWFSFNPQVHASDNDSMVENLPAQAAVAAEARRLANGTPVAISTVNLGRSSSNRGAADPRHASLFGATWTVGSLKHLAEGGADSIAYFDVCGDGGVMLDSVASVRPIYHVLAAVTEFHGGKSLFSRSTNPSQIEGIALRCGERIRLVLTNFRQESQLVSVQVDTPCLWTHSRRLDEFNGLETMPGVKQANGVGQLIVPPLGVVIVDGRLEETQ